VVLLRRFFKILAAHNLKGIKYMCESEKLEIVELYILSTYTTTTMY
jgi:hypothetical protein